MGGMDNAKRYRLRGRLISLVRSNPRLTVREYAEKLGVSRGTVRTWLKAEGFCKVTTSYRRSM